MKIKLDQTLVNAQGEVAVYIDTKKEITLRKVIEDALLYPKEKEDGKAKYVRYEMFKRIMEAKESIELTSEDTAEIKKLIGETKNPLIVGQAWDLLEGKPGLMIVDPNPKPPPPPPDGD